MHNLTEEDTFNKLRRIPYQEIRSIVTHHGSYLLPTRHLQKVLKEHNWTLSEYTSEWAKELNKRR